MYETFFHFKARPFLAAPRVDRYFPGAAIENARQNLTRTIERAEGPGLLVGPAGTGKSLLCQVLAEQFKKTYTIAHFSSARLCTRRALLQAILYELDLPYRDLEEGELRLSLIDHLTTGETAAPNLLFIVDEAHSLPLRLLEEIRMITNLLRDGQPCVRLVLAGLPALEERFAHPKLESFNQRIASRCYLEAFDQHDTYQYVCAQITASGGQPHGILADSAFESIYRATDGVPRLVNQICDHALLLAHAGGMAQISGEVVEEAWADLQQLPLPWTSQAKGQAAQSAIVEFGTLEDEPAPRAPAASVAAEGETFEEMDEQFAPLPFPKQGPAAEALEHLDQIEQQLSELDEEFAPVGTIGPQAKVPGAASFNPFDEAFEEEEVVIDRYAMLDESVFDGRPLVESQSSDGIAHLLKQHEAVPPQPVFSITDTSDSHVELQLELEDELDGTLDDVIEKELEDEFDPVMPEEMIDETLEPAAINTVHSQAAPAGPHVVEGVERLEEDRDLIVIEDEATPPRPARVRRQDYRQLFARLRQA